MSIVPDLQPAADRSHTVETAAVPASIQVTPSALAQEAQTIQILRDLAPSIEQLARCWHKGINNEGLFSAARQLFDIQRAVADSKQLLQSYMPELKGAAEQGNTKVDSADPSPRTWSITLYTQLRSVEEVIRSGYLQQKDPITLRNAVVTGNEANILKVLSTIVASNRISSFDLLDAQNARAINVRADLSKIPLRVDRAAAPSQEPADRATSFLNRRITS
jgi:hypothetical protein